MGEAGLAFVEGRFRPILGARKIRRGMRKGSVEVIVKKLVGNGLYWEMRERKVIIHDDQVRRWPQ
jgi:hypothetical protein